MSLDRQGTVAKAGAPVGVWCDCRVQVNAPSVTFVWGYTWWNWENDGGQSAQQLWQRTCCISLWWAWFKAIYLSDFRKQHRAASKASIHSSDWFWQHIPSPQIGSNLACETILSHQVKKKSGNLVIIWPQHCKQVGFPHMAWDRVNPYLVLAMLLTAKAFSSSQLSVFSHFSVKVSFAESHPVPATSSHSLEGFISFPHFPWCYSCFFRKDLSLHRLPCGQQQQKQIFLWFISAVLLLI